MTSVAITTVQVSVRRRLPPPVPDRRIGTPAEQVRRDLQTFRCAGLSFEKAWDHAYQRVKWPHDTEARREWKAVIAAHRHVWAAAYEDLPSPYLRVRALAD